MIELLFFLLGLIIGLLSGITFICLYFIKSVLDDKEDLKEKKEETISTKEAKSEKTKNNSKVKDEKKNN